MHTTDNYLTALFYGRSGSGKTTTAATFPKKVLLLDVRDRGTDSIKDVKGIDVLNVKSWIEFEAVYWGLLQNKHEYKTIVIDTISNMQDLAIEEVLRKAGLEATEDVSQRRWGEVAHLMTQWIYNFRDLPMHVVFLAQERVRRGTDEDDNYDDQLDPEVGPAVIPSVAKVLCAAVKVIGNNFIRQNRLPSKKHPGKTIVKTDYMMRIGPHAYYITKHRSPKEFTVPSSIRDPSFKVIMELMRGGKTE